MPKANSISQEALTKIRKNVNFNLVLESRQFFGYLKRTDEEILKNWHNIDVTNIQSFNSHRLFKLFAANDSSFSSSLLTHVRMLSDDFRVTAYKGNKSQYVEGQNYLDELFERLNYEDEYLGFTETNTIHDQIARMGRNILTSDNAAGALFIILDKAYKVEQFKIIDCDRIYFKKEKKRRIPYIFDSGKYTDLDYVNFLWQPLDSDAGEIAGNNPLRPGLRTTFTKLEFLDNLRKVLKNQAWPKIKVVLDEEAVINAAPPEVKQDPKKLIDFINDYLSKVESQLSGINPDQNIIIYDTVKEIGFLESSQKFDPTPIAKLLDSELISSFKAPPSTVGRGGSTRTGEGLASAELVIFRRSIKALRKLIETIYSRSFTIALRLNAMQGYAKFRMKEFSLRPEEEAAQFNQIKQDTVIDAWVVGSISTDERDKKLRHMHGFDGKAPADAQVQEDPREPKPDKQTERGAISNENKEKKREETRKNQKTGNDNK